MSDVRLAPEAETELDEIWLHIARESGSVDIATRVINKITDHFWLLARYPYFGRPRGHDLQSGIAQFSRERLPPSTPHRGGGCRACSTHRPWSRDILRLLGD